MSLPKYQVHDETSQVSYKYLLFIHSNGCANWFAVAIGWIIISFQGFFGTTRYFCDFFMPIWVL